MTKFVTMNLKRNYSKYYSKGSFAIIRSCISFDKFSTLIKFKYNNFKKISIFSFGFIILLFTEISIRYTGIFNSVIFVFTILPIILIIILYFF